MKFVILLTILSFCVAAKAAIPVPIPCPRCTCIKGFTYNTVTCQCVPNFPNRLCRSPWILNHLTGECDLTTCKQEFCKPDYTFLLNTCKCVQNKICPVGVLCPPCTCIKGFTYNTVTCQCDPNFPTKPCRYPWLFNHLTGECDLTTCKQEFCKTGFSFDVYACKCVQIKTCP